MTTLHNDLVRLLAYEYVDPRTRRAMRCVCRHWYRAVAAIPVFPRSALRKAARSLRSLSFGGVCWVCLERNASWLQGYRYDRSRYALVCLKCDPALALKRHPLTFTMLLIARAHSRFFFQLKDGTGYIG